MRKLTTSTNGIALLIMLEFSLAIALGVAPFAMPGRYIDYAAVLPLAVLLVLSATLYRPRQDETMRASVGFHLFGLALGAAIIGAWSPALLALLGNPEQIGVLASRPGLYVWDAVSAHLLGGWYSPQLDMLASYVSILVAAVVGLIPLLLAFGHLRQGYQGLRHPPQSYRQQAAYAA